ncbi:MULTISPECIES: iron-containing alcohol dehydrogenase [Priestia]|uniref:Iron-containing alcohol dehydrogenase n=1 Tax=Priestia aryabhattai TaxID=412384 RepID=A0AAX6N2V9_PRIAR|nr:MULTISPECIES: iron-containing alcohol dehydrogenase [Priestia]MDT0149282.1 iron-containing alcohol dehydrogenase [Priestia aryabhattai]MDT0155068.1 iron-containing alcohol dehydrogenase [Priestia aryabhattai]MDU9690228.1 iron-containing alcohol dehydrogenase [Priestia aryabhattai]MED3955762.1 iron-containing alcohol dehydrogenase [Priestia aryabhattai]MED3987998.1 iron-containing alcohol dehydrogenase [Priestia aryabhattai]
MQKLYQFQTANHLIAGPNSIEKVGEHLSLLGTEVKSALIITQPSMKRLGFVEKLIHQLSDKGVSAYVNIDVLPEPTVENIEEVFQAISKEQYDVLIGFGGGSVLDATKILSVLQTNNQSIRELLGTDLVKNPGTPTILIPTTSGTGSEVTPNAIVTLPDEELKIGIVSKYLLPKLVVLDPVLTLSLPRPITAATGMDAFTHSLESFISNKSNLISDMVALESIRLISSSIIEAYQNGNSVEAREKMLVGSMYGGMALTSAGTAAVHALAYPLGGKFKIPHGVANSMLLPHVMEFNMDAIEDRLFLVAEPMGIKIEGFSKTEVAQKVVNRIVEWTNVLEIPQNLKEYGVKEEDVPELALSASKVTRLLNNNPKEVSLKDMEGIYRKLLV